MYHDLIKELSDLDKEKINNYINLYGVKEKFIGVDKWLQNWNYSNQKLFKLLGKSLIKKVPIKIEKNLEAMTLQLNELVKNNYILSSFYDLRNYFWSLADQEQKIEFTRGGFDSVFYKAARTSIYLQDQIDESGKYHSKITGKTYQIQNGMKPIRVLKKLIDFFKYEIKIMLQSTKEKSDSYYQGLLDNIDSIYEDFRIGLSMIFNDKYLIGNLCISIHPLDFMTMSDNASDWSSCMSWIEEGCHRIGTVEMMNSNNALCCYLESDSPFVFIKDKDNKKNDIQKAEENPGFVWNNKKWRTLVYVNKNIVMTGKSYPYYNESVDKELLKAIVELAKENMNWSYQYGPERYQDMIHIYSAKAMENNKKWIRYKDTKKHNIIWDTKGMYNDMLNANDYTYWCYRNPVKHNIIYSVSGKSPCLCCGNQVSHLENSEHYDYNDRYLDTDKLVCYHCRRKYFYCNHCRSFNTLSHYYKIRFPESDIEYEVCGACIDSALRTCPCCGKYLFITETNSNFVPVFIPPNYTDYEEFISVIKGIETCWQSDELINKKNKWGIIERFGGEEKYAYLERLYMCKDCWNKIPKNEKEDKDIHLNGHWAWEASKIKKVKTLTWDYDDQKKFFYRNMDPIKKEELNKIFNSEEKVLEVNYACNYSLFS